MMNRKRQAQLLALEQDRQHLLQLHVLRLRLVQWLVWMRSLALMAPTLLAALVALLVIIHSVIKLEVF